ncbi:hypothetical protein [Desmospora activa]|uniref:Uncharacterized protein n=1 Tax=Desmospora activa DSM 45169 TaxID=1121389 RepID=A0A2T4Z770_9BACL|nr:hypothetical protein [Desmospora activa]PTM57744.1 hypothetical protein C8J48_0296 [Desmospora activa DSM 45169]
MSLSWLMIGLLTVLSLLAVIIWVLFQLNSRMDSSSEIQTVATPSGSDDSWEWFGEGELSGRTGLSTGKSLPLSIEKETMETRPGWVRLHISIAQSEPGIIQQAVGEGLKRLKGYDQGGEVRVYADGKWVGSGGFIPNESAASWLEGLADQEREAIIRQVKSTGTPVFLMRKMSE